MTKQLNGTQVLWLEASVSLNIQTSFWQPTVAWYDWNGFMCSISVVPDAGASGSTRHTRAFKIKTWFQRSLASVRTEGITKCPDSYFRYCPHEQK
jgi:hypothetical protein